MPAPLRLPDPTQADVGFTSAQYAAIERLDRDDNLRDPTDLEGLRRLLARDDLTPEQRRMAEIGLARATGGESPPPLAQRAAVRGRTQITSVEEARKAMPELAGLDDQGVVNVLQQAYYPNTPRERVAAALGVKESEAPPPPKEGLGAAVARGAKESFQQLPQLGFGLGAGVAAGAESAFGEGGASTAIKEYATKKYQEWGEKIAAQAQPTDSLENSWEAAKQGDIGALASWLSHGIGYTGGQALQALASFGIGSAGGKFVANTAAKQIAEGMVQREAARLTGGAVTEASLQQATKNVADKFANIGAMTAVGGMGFGQEGGEIFGTLAERSVKEGRALSGDEIARGMWTTLAAGGLEFVGDKFGLDLVMGKSGLLKPAQAMEGMAGRAARAGLGAAAAIPVEAGTEYLQTGLEAYGGGTEQNILPFDQSREAQSHAFEAAALGALGGGLVGGAGGLLSRAKERSTLAATADALDGERRVAAEAATRLATAPDLPSMAQAASDLAFSSNLLPPGLVRAAGAEAATTIDHVRAGVVGDAEVSDAPFGDRALTAREQLADPAVIQAIRDQFGPEAVDNALYYLGVADNPTRNVPDVTRERMLGVAESIISRALLRPIAEPRALPGIGPGPAQIGMNAPPPQIGMDTTPTGRMVTTPDGVTRPETRSDLLSRAPATAQSNVEARTAAERQAEIAAAGGPGMVLSTPRGEEVIDQNAAATAVSDTNDKVASKNQILAGNAELGHDRETFPGLNLSIENDAGSIRQDLKNDPPKWKTLMRHHYGYIRGTKGKDKDHVDVFVKPGTPKGYTGTVYVVDQNNRSGGFDEHKVMLGFASEQEAREAYLSNYEKGWTGLRAITPMDFNAFKAWVFNPALTVLPLGKETGNAADATSEPESTGAQHREGEGGGQAPEASGGDRVGGAAESKEEGRQEDDQVSAGPVVDRSRFDGIKVKLPITLDSGKKASMTVDAGKALRDLDARHSAFTSLLDCLAKGGA